jgi:replication factor C small subunit
MKLNQIWCEKYRPQTLNDLCISKKTRDIIEGFGKDIPHLLLTGKTGVGKTTTSRIIVQDILKCDYLYINASDENGIDTVRNKINGFVQTKSFDGGLKIVILDEADFFTTSGQSALRNIMETYASTARFILTGNHKHKISVALQSRCQELDISPSLSDCLKRCLHILSVENVTVDGNQKKELAKLVKKHFPDLRKCINEMQKQTVDNILCISPKKATSELVETIFNNITKKQSLVSRKLLIENDEIFNNDHESLLVDLLNFVYDVELEDTKKKQMIIIIAEHLFKMNQVMDREINTFACLLNLEEI